MGKAKTPVHQGQGRILVMDDEEFVLDVIAQMLDIMGYEVLAARNGDEAVAFARDAEAAGRHLSAAILDLTIPGGRGGKEVVTELLTIVPSLKVFASSGYSEDPAMSRPSDYGFADRLIKPYRMEDLAKMLGALI